MKYDRHYRCYARMLLAKMVDTHMNGGDFGAAFVEARAYLEMRPRRFMGWRAKGPWHTDQPYPIYSSEVFTDRVKAEAQVKRCPRLKLVRVYRAPKAVR